MKNITILVSWAITGNHHWSAISWLNHIGSMLVWLTYYSFPALHWSMLDSLASFMLADALHWSKIDPMTYCWSKSRYVGPDYTSILLE